jgi:hypothetical protein
VTALKIKQAGDQTTSNGFDKVSAHQLELLSISPVFSFCRAP